MIKYLLPISVALLVITSCSKPIASFMYQADTDSAPTNITTENKSQNADMYLWDFGDGTKSKEVNPSHTYPLSGRYVISLEAKKNNKISITEKEIIVEAPKDCRVLVKTNMGDMTILLSDETPEHRDNFLKLVNEGFYNGLLFHRVINGFMIQGGDPKSKGADENARLGGGGPGYTVPAEFVPELLHYKGALAAARTGDAVNPEKNSSGSQFYLVHGNLLTDDQLNKIERQSGHIYTDEQREEYKTVGGTPFLDHNYTVFGRVVEGLDIIDKIAATPTQPGDRPTEDVIILEMTAIK